MRTYSDDYHIIIDIHLEGDLCIGHIKMKQNVWHQHQH